MKNILYLFFLAALLATVGCSKDNEENGDNGGDKPNVLLNKPHWAAYSDLTLSAAPDWRVEERETVVPSMTATIALDDALLVKGSEDDILAAICNGEILGVASPDYSYFYNQRFFLYINEPSGDASAITFAYYCASTNTVRYWQNAMRFATDRIYGNPSEPYVLSLSSSILGFPCCIMISAQLPSDICTFEENDELAVFSGGQCRYVISVNDLMSDSGDVFFLSQLPLNKPDEPFFFRYYSSKNDRIYTSPVYQANEDAVTFSIKGLKFD